MTKKYKVKFDKAEKLKMSNEEFKDMVNNKIDEFEIFLIDKLLSQYDKDKHKCKPEYLNNRLKSSYKMGMEIWLDKLESMNWIKFEKEKRRVNNVNILRNNKEIKR